MKELPNQVTPDDRERLAEFVKKWQWRLGLMDWRINVSPVPSKRAVMAEVYKQDFEQRSATIRMGVSFGEVTEVNDANIESLAVHELLHIFLAEFKTLAMDGESNTADTVSSAEHRLINILEVLLLTKESV
jgi:hypothetical protein